MIRGNPGKKVIKIVIPYNKELNITRLGSSPQRASMLASEVSRKPHPEMLMGNNISKPRAQVRFIFPLVDICITNMAFNHLWH